MLPQAAPTAPVITYEQALANVRALAPKLKARAALAESSRRIPAETLQELHASGLMRVLQPRRVGGSELPWVALVDIGSGLAAACASTAWNWANYAVHHWMLAFWPVACQDEIWGADPDMLIASSVVFPAGKATRVSGGYRLSGRWQFSSGVDPSAWNMLGGIVTDGENPGEYRIFLLPREDYRIIDNWHVMGLRGTGSNDVEAKDVFVPEARTLAVDATRGGANHPGAELNTGALFRIPIFATFPYMLTGIALGIAQGAYESVVDGLRERVARYSGKSLADMTAVQIRIAEAGACIDTARRVMRDHCHTAQTLAEQGDVPDLLLKATWRRDGAFSAGLCERAVDVLFKLGGGGALFDDHPLQRAFRDVHAATAHISMIWEAQATTFGRVALGLPCDNPTL
ncbi:MAG TPA: acyl-CoA dehydrogenase family protein [Casimicrobiaceae bacterium]|nr:acyl-CoA dehydrogenase family protein [Casimicrobiaceae bacterium]